MSGDPAGRYCKSCHYDLRGSVEPVCPECGCEFDPENPATYLKHITQRVPSILRVLEVLVIAYPLLVIAGAKVCYVAGRIRLGHWPRSSLDDPAQIGIDLLYVGTVILLLCAPYVGIVSIFIFLMSAGLRLSSELREIRSVLICLLIFLAWIMLILDHTIDPWGIWYWFYD